MGETASDEQISQTITLDNFPITVIGKIDSDSELAQARSKVDAKVSQVLAAWKADPSIPKTYRDAIDDRTLFAKELDPKTGRMVHRRLKPNDLAPSAMFSRPNANKG